MLKCDRLTCVREERVLFKNLSFTIKPGEIVQVEGPNGVGKTSLFRLLIGLSLPYEGKVCWQAQNILKDRQAYYQNMLYLGHKSGVKPELTALENIQFYQHLHCCKETVDAWDVLLKVGLVGYENIPTAQLSAGQQRRVALARLWFNHASLWILDEPFTAIDKKGVQVIQNLLLEHVQAGGMVLLTTHQDLSIPNESFSKLRLEKPSAGEEYV